MSLTLEEYRLQIDEADRRLIRAFSDRMKISAGISGYKKEHHMKVHDPAREQVKLRQAEEQVEENLQDYVDSLYSLLFDLSCSYQNRTQKHESALTATIREAIDTTEKLFPQRVKVACQGVEGSNSQLACRRVFRFPEEFFYHSFDDVFTAVENGECRFGILPIENSTAGSVNEVYDRMIRHRFHIVRSVRIKVDHNLLANEGATLEGIREIYSHPQAIHQCADFIASLKDVKVVECANTAVAARMVAESGRTDVASLSTHACMELYELKCLRHSVQDSANNYTRFIVISRDLKIFPGADRTSLSAVLPHRPGALYKVLSRFYALGIDLNKLESRPIPQRNFEFMFYFDLEVSVYDPRFLELIEELGYVCEELTYLGSYTEIL